MINESSNFSSLSNISKKSRGVKGAVKSAHQSASQGKNLQKLEETLEKSDKSPMKEYLDLVKAE